MNTYIVLLRGVMPKGKNSIPKMAFLREVLENDGFKRVRTYIQTGNLVLETDLPPFAVSEKLQNLIREHIHADLPVIVKTAQEIRDVLCENPFTEESYDASRIFYSLSNQEIPLCEAQVISDYNYCKGCFAYTTKACYMYLPKDASRSKLNNNFLEKKLGITMTTRNGNTLTRLIEIASDDARL